MFSFHESLTDTLAQRQSHAIAVFGENGEPISGEQRSMLLLRLNRLGGLDPDDPVWIEPESGSELRVAEMLENKTEPADATDSLRRLGGAIIRRLVLMLRRGQ